MKKHLFFILTALLAACSPAAAGPAAEALGPADAVLVPEPGNPVPLAGDREKVFLPGKYNSLIWDGRSKDDWYEWWYYKVVVPGTARAFYFCYGVVNPWDRDQTAAPSRAYVSAGNFEAGQTHELTFPVKSFHAKAFATYVEIGGNLATDKALKGRLPLSGGEEFSWDLTLEKDWAFNAMGWTMYPPGISNIFWFPAQASAYMSGAITYRGETFTLSRAPAYQDRNWGKSFPKWWAWLVSNHFKGSPGTVLAAGGGLPKVLGGIDFPNAMGIGLRHKGREYAFRPGSGDLIRLDVNFGKWKVLAANREGQRIEITAFAPREKFLLLKFMAPQGIEFHDYEALKGTIKVKLYDGGKLVADLETQEGGIEFGAADPQDFSRLFSGEHKLQ
ncbi:MAG: tocopherol cyclase family protein [Elusimicrobiales bacterium]|nr:tocopherol cyclase family protein [Elusimicrobiales bacterium]